MNEKNRDDIMKIMLDIFENGTEHDYLVARWWRFSSFRELVFSVFGCNKS